ncbi:MAG: hypothetical protein EOO77_26425, partial [Oxalobacteraceae bacterium]
MAALDANLHDLEHLGWDVDDALVDGGNTATSIECVFLTGSTTFVRALRALFAGNFGATRISGGGDFLSVTERLALIGVKSSWSMQGALRRGRPG